MNQKESVRELAKNLDYSLRVSGAKKVLIASDKKGDGKSTFAAGCLPVLSELYDRKILYVTDEPTNAIEGIDCITDADFIFTKGLTKKEALLKRLSYIHHTAKHYDITFIDSTTLKRAEKTKLPVNHIDGAILVRSDRTIGAKHTPVTNEILDKNIPVIGIVYNGAK